MKNHNPATLDMLETIRKTLDDKQAQDIKIIDVHGRSPITDFYIIVTGNSCPHLRALADDIHSTLRSQGINYVRRTGDSESGWVCVDCVDVIIHILSKEMRAYYAIEELWEIPH